MTPILHLVAGMGPAHAGTTLHTYAILPGFDDPLPDEVTLSIECPAGKEVVGGGAIFYNSSKFQASGATASASSYIGRWQRVPGAPPLESSINTFAEGGAVCTDETDCLHRYTTTLPIEERDSATVSLTCPAADQFAIGGGFTLTGQTSGVEVYASGPLGLLAPVGWQARARRLTSGGPWGMEVEVRCLESEVFGVVTATTDFEDYFGSEYSFPPEWPFVFTTGATLNLDGPSIYWDSWKLAVGGRAKGPGGLTALTGIGVSGGVVVGVAVFAQEPWPYPSLVPMDKVALFADPTALSQAFAECGPHWGTGPTPEPQAPPYFEIGAEVWFGLIAGGGGVIFLPGTGPVPVDPEPFHAAFASLPVAVVTYTDPRERDARLAEVTRGLDAGRTPWVRLDDAAGTAGLEFPAEIGVSIVVPADEAGAVRWLSANRTTLASLAHPTIVVLEADGVGMRELAAW